MKKLTIAIMLICLLFAFTACNNSDAKYTVGLIQLMEHPSLDEIRAAIEADLKAEFGDDIEILYQNGQNDKTLMNSISQQFVGQNVDAIIAIATPAAQAAAAATEDIPIIFAAVTDPVASNLVLNIDAPESNITGTSDAIDVDKIFSLAAEMYPEIKTYGFIYNTSEDNSLSVIADAKAYLDSKNIKYVESVVTNVGEVSQAAQALVGKCDAIFSPIDNTVASGMRTLADIAIDAKMPVFVSADSMVADGGLATVGVNYTQLGKQTAAMAIKALKGTAISEIPVEVLTECAVTVNEDTAKAIGIDVSKYLK